MKPGDEVMIEGKRTKLVKRYAGPTVIWKVWPPVNRAGHHYEHQITPVKPKPRAKAKRPFPKITGRDPVSQLYRAVIRYVEASGGSLLVIGGIQIQEWPEEYKGSFRIAVKCLGLKPRFDSSKRKVKACPKAKGKRT